MKVQFVRPRIALPDRAAPRALDREKRCVLAHGVVGWLVGAQRDRSSNRAWCAHGVCLSEVSSFG